MFNLVVRSGMILMCLLCIVDASAQTFEQFEQIANVSLEESKAVAQDDQSYMWFSNNHGVFRYDGHRLVPLSELVTDTLQALDKGVFRIKKDESGNMWFVGDNGVLIHLNTKTYNSKVFDLPITDKLNNNYTYDISFDKTNAYLATETGLLILDRQTEKIEILFPKEMVVGEHQGDINTLYGLLQDRFQQDKLWLLSRGGLMSFSKSEKTVQYHTKTLTGLYNYGTTSIWNARQDDQGRLWPGGGYYGLKYYDPAVDNWTWHPNEKYMPTTDQTNHIFQSYIKSEDEYWVFSPEEGFGTMHKDGNNYQYVERNPESKQSILKGRYAQIFQDKDGAFWITGKQGVSYFNPNFQIIEKIKLPKRTAYDSEDEMHVISWEQISKEQVLVGSICADGVYNVNTNTKSIEAIDLIKKLNGKMTNMKEYFGKVRPIWDILKTAQDEIFVSVGGKLLQCNTSLNILEEVNAPFAREIENLRVWKMKNFSNGDIYFINNFREVIQLDGKTLEVLHTYSYDDIFAEETSVKGDYLSDFSEDSRGNIWLSSHHNLYKLNPNAKTISPVTLDNRTLLDFLNIGSDQIDISADDILFSSNNSNGLLKIDLNKGPDSFRIYTMKDGLPSNNVYSTSIDKLGNAWFGTSSGLCKYDFETDAFSIVQEKHGIIEDNHLHFWFPAMEISNTGNLYFYSPEYFVWTKAEGFSKHNSNPKAKINAIQVLDRPESSSYNLNANEIVKLNYNENYFSIHLGSDNYTLTNGQKFKYILEGFDENWRTSDKASISYTKVPPGVYKFSLQVADFNGNWSKSPTSVDIEIIPPFWKTNWFRLLCLLALLAIGYFVYKYWENNLKEKERLKAEFDNKIAQIEMDALRAQMNPHFLFNCLNSIKNYALTKGPYETADYLTKFSHLIRLILQNSKSSTVMLKDELEALKLYVEIEDLRFAEQFDYSFNLDDDLDVLSAHIPPMILQPYVENAIWHGLMHKTDGKGKLDITIKNMGKHLQCTIEDNGIGREKAMEIKKRKEGLRKKSLGMKITKNRIDLTNQLYNIDTKVNIVDLKNTAGEGIGTRIVIEIPLIDKQV